MNRWHFKHVHHKLLAHPIGTVKSDLPQSTQSTLETQECIESVCTVHAKHLHLNTKHHFATMDFKLCTKLPVHWILNSLLYTVCLHMWLEEPL